MNKITVIGVDLAKNVIQVSGIAIESRASEQIPDKKEVCGVFNAAAAVSGGIRGVCDGGQPCNRLPCARVNGC